VDKVATLGKKRQQRAETGMIAAFVTAALWKQQHTDLWEFVQTLDATAFKQTLIKAIEDGSITKEQEETLIQMLKQKRKNMPAPEVGMPVNVKALITSALPATDNRGDSVFRIEFTTDLGWRGRVDTFNKMISDRVQGRRHNHIQVSGSVVWCKENFVILSKQTDIKLIV
jgi:hypothetical protein